MLRRLRDGPRSAPRDGPGTRPAGHPLERAAAVLIRPHVLVLVPLALSLLAWIPPWGHVHTGFDRREEVTLGGTLYLAGWYGAAVVAAVLGYRLGRRTAPLRLYEETSTETYYRYLTATAAAGLAYSYGKAVRADPDLFLDSLRTQTFNQFRSLVGQESGPATLRYAAVLSGGYALYELFVRSRLRALHVVNVGLLAFAGALGSRLSFILAALVVVALYACWGGPDRAPWLRFGVLLIALFVALTGANYIRNANFYRANYDTSNPVVMNFHGIVSYLAAPFQGGIGVANHATSGVPEGIETARKDPGLNRVTNPGAERGTAGWRLRVEGPGAPPVLSRSTAPADVEIGYFGFLAEWRNGTRRRRAVHLETGPGRVPVRTGEVLYVRADVGGPASAGTPMRLALVPGGVRAGRRDGGLGEPEPVGNGLAKVNDEPRWPLEGLYTVPAGVRSVRLVLSQDAEPGESVRISLDEAIVAWVPDDGYAVPALGPALRRYLLPTYFGALDSDVFDIEDTYRRHVDVTTQLTTNSALSTMYTSLGHLAFLLLAGASLLTAILIGHASRYRSFAFVTVVAAGYCFAELWRLYLFNRGLIHFLVLAVVTIPLFHQTVRRHVAPRLRRALVSVRS